MQMSAILSYLKDYIILGIILIIIFLLGYEIVYKKIMKGTKTINKKRMLLYGVTIGYLTIVFGATFLTRQNSYKEINLHLFSSYKEAWNNMSDSLSKNIILRNSILNILLFVPFGFILPMYSEKLKKIYKVVPIGLAVTLLIEIIQYITNMGIFEIDDVFNNTLGALIGYCIFMIFNNLIKKENRKYIFAYVLPFIFAIGTFISYNVVYQKQELGNLPLDYTYKINMKNTEVICNAEFSKETSTQNIYYTKILTNDEIREIAKTLFEKNGTSIDENEMNQYEGGDTALYYAVNHQQNIWINYKGGTYNYNTGSSGRLLKELYKQENNVAEESKEIEKLDDGIQTEEKIEAKASNIAVQEVNDTAIKIQGASREEIIEALKNIGIEVPEEAEFKEENGNYIFIADMIMKDNSLVDGKIRCSYYIDKTLDNITNNIVTYEKVKEKEIISEEEAYNKVLEGKFKYPEHIQGKIKSMTIESVSLKYMLDTKGYYVPVYEFKAKINDKESSIVIKAIKE